MNKLSSRVRRRQRFNLHLISAPIVSRYVTGGGSETELEKAVMAKWEKEKPRVRQTTCEIQKSLSNTGIGNFFFFKKMGQPRPLFHLFSSFQTNIIRIFTTNKCVKKCPSSIQCWDLNPQPSKHESSPITTSPELPPRNRKLLYLETHS